MSLKRAVVYIDGFNLNHSLKDSKVSGNSPG